MLRSILLLPGYRGAGFDYFCVGLLCKVHRLNRQYGAPDTYKSSMSTPTLQKLGRQAYTLLRTLPTSIPIKVIPPQQQKSQMVKYPFMVHHYRQYSCQRHWPPRGSQVPSSLAGTYLKLYRDPNVVFTSRMTPPKKIQERE